MKPLVEMMMCRNVTGAGAPCGVLSVVLPASFSPAPS
jgi:hypothetical protein